jgi:hypothetical protein
VRFSGTRRNNPDFILTPVMIRHHQQATEAIHAQRHKMFFVMVAVFNGNGAVIVKTPSTSARLI